jgi:hypothetical protein
MLPNDLEELLAIGIELARAHPADPPSSARLAGRVAAISRSTRSWKIT